MYCLFFHMIVDHCLQFCDDGPLSTIQVTWLYPDVVMTRVSSHRDGSTRSCDVQNCRDDHLSKIVTMMTVRIYRLYVLKNDIIRESIEISPLFSKQNTILYLYLVNCQLKITKLLLWFLAFRDWLVYYDGSIIELCELYCYSLHHGSRKKQIICR